MKADAAPVVFVIDDDASMRCAIADLLESVGTQVQVFASTQEFLAMDRRDAPGCLVLDVRLPGQSGLDFQRCLASRGIDIPIVFITGFGDVSVCVRAMKAGAVDFLTKPFRNQELLDAVQSAIQRDRARRVGAHTEQQLRQRVANLTGREREVLSHVVSGRINKQIAAALDLSEATIKLYRGQVMRKMQARSLPELVRFADCLGL